MSHNIPKNVPLLPGYCFNDRKENYHKTQQFSMNQNTRCEKIDQLKEDIDEDLQERVRQAEEEVKNLTLRKSDDFDKSDYEIEDKKCLCFHAYYQESVHEHRYENSRIIPCIILFYPADGTMQINEKKQPNSGLFRKPLARQRVLKKLGEAGNYYEMDDLNVGINVNIYERVFRIIDCDSSTREYYKKRGVELGQKEELPKDNYMTYLETRDTKICPPDFKDYKEYNEVNLGGGHPNNGLKKYLDNDRKVLSFSVIWNDTSLEGDINFYTLNLFLADDTIEVKEIRKANSGKEKFPLLLNRKKIPKKPIHSHYPGMTYQKEEFYGPDDLICGNTITIYSKPCVIYDCDDFTKHWYEVNKGLKQQTAQLAKNTTKRYYQPIPPYNGFGSQEDSMGYCLNLEPKPPKKDINKMYTQDQYILRFEARLITENSEDKNRNFTVSFFCGDDTVMVFENADKNSGITNGKFLERNKYTNPITKKYYNEIDFQIGETITILVHKFQLVRADEYTHKYMKTKPHIFKEADIQFVLDRMMTHAQRYQSLEAFLIELVRKLDRNKNGKIEFEELVVGIKQELGLNLTYQELYTLMRYFDTDGDWKLSMQELFVGLGGKRC